MINPATDPFQAPACDFRDTVVCAWCPDASGTSPSSGNPPSTTPTCWPEDDYPAGSSKQLGTIDCVMPGPPAGTTWKNKILYGYAEATGLFMDQPTSGPGVGTPTSAQKPATVTVNSCEVKVDKQVSCDGGTTWIDQGLVTADDGSNPCTAYGLDKPVQVRYQVQNSGNCPLTNCLLTETNGQFGTPDPVGNLAVAETTSFLPAKNTPACQTACGGEYPNCPNEPNTAEVTCQTGGTEVKANDKAAFKCEKCEVQLDKQISCDGGANWKDIGYGDSVAQLCEAAGLNSQIKVQYQVKNPTGSPTDPTAGCPLTACTLTESNSEFRPVPAVGDLAPLQEKPNLPAGTAPICEKACGTNTGDDCPNEPNTATVTCKDPAGKDVTSSDQADLKCNVVPPLSIVKDCVDSDNDGTDDSVSVTVTTGVGNVNHVNCTVSDGLYRDDTCPATGTADPIALSPSGSFSLAPKSEKTFTGGPLDLEQDACNVASVTCTIEGGSDVTETADPVPCVGPPSEPTGCRITAGGFVDQNTDDVDLSTLAETRTANFGGQVGAPCGCINCYAEFDHIQGQWEHNRKRGGRLHASDYNSLICGCEKAVEQPDGSYTWVDADLDGNLCNPDDRISGPEPRRAPANRACWTGVGTYKQSPAGFRVEVKDHGEPSTGKNADGTLDEYKIWIYPASSLEDAKKYSEEACCKNPVAPTRKNMVVDGGTLLKGNIQIHPLLPNTEKDKCPVSNPSGTCQDDILQP